MNRDVYSHLKKVFFCFAETSQLVGEHGRDARSTRLQVLKICACWLCLCVRAHLSLLHGRRRSLCGGLLIGLPLNCVQMDPSCRDGSGGGDIMRCANYALKYGGTSARRCSHGSDGCKFCSVRLLDSD